MEFDSIDTGRASDGDLPIGKAVANAFSDPPFSGRQNPFVARSTYVLPICHLQWSSILRREFPYPDTRRPLSICGRPFGCKRFFERFGT